ncbi:uncharacterized protein [Dermacentor albipictus]|uniref:uncharacterized protein isoform X4 n=1 Tax=Dermacentor albipictus TaxID=60249 RepID=UPI0038FC6A72
MWLTTQMHREEELAAMQYPAGNWSSSCNKIAGTCGTSQWPFECLAEGAHGGRSASHRIYHRLEVHFHYNAFPEPSLRDLRHYSCAVTALTEPQPITAHVHVCQLLNHKMVQPLECSGKKVFRDNLVLQSLCVSFDIGLQFKPDGLYVKMYNGMVFIMAKPLY